MTWRFEYVEKLVKEVAPEVWRRSAGNGGLVIHVDTDVDCYGEWYPHDDEAEDRQVMIAQTWVQYFVRSTINRLIANGTLTVPDDRPIPEGFVDGGPVLDELLAQPGMAEAVAKIEAEQENQ